MPVLALHESESLKTFLFTTTTMFLLFHHSIVRLFLHRIWRVIRPHCMLSCRVDITALHREVCTLLVRMLTSAQMQAHSDARIESRKGTRPKLAGCMISYALCGNICLNELRYIASRERQDQIFLRDFAVNLWPVH